MVLPLDIVFIRASRLLFGGIPGAYLTFLQQLMIAALAVLPAGLLSGLLFQWTANVLRGKRQNSGRRLMLWKARAD